MNKPNLVTDPFDKKYAIDEDAMLCKRVKFKSKETGKVHDLGYIQQEAR